ncbi:MAG: ABC transporter ATP-binding protein [Propionibacteriaceae bacterium]
MDAGSVRLDAVRVGYRSGRRWPFRDPDMVVVDAIDAVAQPGELTAVLGPNGAGKSTLLRSLIGLQPLLSGTISLGEVDLGRVSLAERARRAAVVLTDRVDAGLLTGREVVELGRHPHQGPFSRLDAADHRVATEAITHLHAEELVDQRFSEMSDGQRQRVLLARALCQQPELLILDEPTAFLDVGARVDLMALLRRTADERGITILVSTHEVELALRMSDTVWLIDGSELITGTPEELITDGSVARVFETPSTEFDARSRTFRLRSAGTLR